MLFILSMASGYGGAERSIELILRHLPACVAVRVYAESEFHLDRLTQPGALLGNAGLVRISSTSTIWARRIAALRLAFDCWRYPQAKLLINTAASAHVAAMAAKFIPGLGHRCHIYVRDFLWNDLDYIFGRLRGAKVFVPSAVVVERLGYLTPFYLAPVGTCPVNIVPDMVEIPSGPVSYEGPLLHLASVNPWKGHVDLMMALRMLKQRGQAISAKSHGVIGNVALNTRLHQLVDLLEISDCYALCDYVADPGELLRECGAVVVPSVSHSGGPETFGRAVIEAWAYRKPVVAYASGAVAQLVEDGVDGLLVPEGNVQALSDALQRLSDSPELSKRLGEAGHDKVRRLYEASAVTRRLLEALEVLEDPEAVSA
jgi:glycosyltransferase involved in cell wall biosynthesis